MSECRVPNWILRQQRQEYEEGEEAGNRHVRSNQNHQNHHHHPNSYVVPMSNTNEIAELKCEDGQLAFHELGGIIPSTNSTTPAKTAWGDTLESIVHQATLHNLNFLDHNLLTSSKVASAPSRRKWGESSGTQMVVPGPTGFAKKRPRASEKSNQCGGNRFGSSSIVNANQEDGTSACASATLCKVSTCDTSGMMTMTFANSFESPRGLKSTRTADEVSGSACHDESENQEEECKIMAETVRFHSTRRSRVAAVHNQSERRRRDRINQKMKALQKLVPNASKTDKASMLDEVIKYLKQLQAQVQMMVSLRNMPQMMMQMPPLGLGMQHHHHHQQQQQQQMYSLLAAARMAGLGRMGMGGMLGMGAPVALAPLTTDSTATLVTPPLSVVPPPPMINPWHASAPTSASSQATSPQAATSAPIPFHDPYYAFLAQSMNIELYNKMGALYQQEVNQGVRARSSPSESNHVKGE